jgi:ribosomal protein S27AE
MKGKHAHVNCEACHGALIQRLPAAPQPEQNLYRRLLALVIPPIPVESTFVRHADDPGSVIPPLPDTAVLCGRCHTASAAKPKGFPQVDPAEHAQGLACGSCHKPHDPGMNAGGAK